MTVHGQPPVRPSGGTAYMKCWHWMTTTSGARSPASAGRSAGFARAASSSRGELARAAAALGGSSGRSKSAIGPMGDAARLRWLQMRR